MVFDKLNMLCCRSKSHRLCAVGASPILHEPVDVVVELVVPSPTGLVLGEAAPVLLICLIVVLRSHIRLCRRVTEEG